MTHIHHTPIRRSSRGFTLMEVLIAMGIFAVGFATLAAIFPAAALLQKETVDDNITQQVGRNAQAVLLAMEPQISDYLEALGEGPVVRLLDETPNLVLSEHDRSFPSTMDVEARRYFWVPLGMRTSDGEQRAFVFVLRRGSGVTYPRHGDEDQWANLEDGEYDEFVGTSPVTSYRVPGVYKTEAVHVVGTDTLFVPDDGAGPAFRVRTDPRDSHLGIGDWIVDGGGILYQIIDIPANNQIKLDGPIVGDPSFIWCVPRGEHANGTIRRTSPVIRVVPLTIE